MLTWKAGWGNFILAAALCVGSDAHFRMLISGGSGDPRWWPGYVLLSIAGVPHWVALGCHLFDPGQSLWMSQNGLKAATSFGPMGQVG